jgi:nucleotide-binding universal stress UspA family protein
LSKTIKEKEFSKILVPVDGSEQSMRAADYAIELAIKYNAHLVALYVIHIPSMYYAYRHTLIKFLEDSRLEIQQFFDKILGKIK